MRETLCSGHFMSLFHLILWITLWDNYYNLHFNKKNTEPQTNLFLQTGESEYYLGVSNVKTHVLQSHFNMEIHEQK